MGERNLGYLRDLKVTFGYYKGFFDTFHLTYDAVNGLKAKVEESSDWSYDPRDEQALDHIARVKARNEEANSESTGVIDFFVANTDSLRRILYSYRLLTERDYEYGRCGNGPNERNAYDVAYGECWLDCPW